jgi:hypothetical protein
MVDVLDAFICSSSMTKSASLILGGFGAFVLGFCIAGVGIALDEIGLRKAGVPFDNSVYEIGNQHYYRPRGSQWPAIADPNRLIPHHVYATYRYYDLACRSLMSLGLLLSTGGFVALAAGSSRPTRAPSQTSPGTRQQGGG